MFGAFLAWRFNIVLVYLVIFLLSRSKYTPLKISWHCLLNTCQECLKYGGHVCGKPTAWLYVYSCLAIITTSTIRRLAKSVWSMVAMVVVSLLPDCTIQLTGYNKNQHHKKTYQECLKYGGHGCGKPTAWPYTVQLPGYNDNQHDHPHPSDAHYLPTTLAIRR